MPDEKISVFHSVPRWLPQTQAWLYHQLAHLPEDVDSTVVCARKLNLDQFPFSHVIGLDDLPPVARFCERLCLHLRVRRHFGYLHRLLRHADRPLLHSHFGTTGVRNIEATRSTGARHLVTFYGSDVGQAPRIDPRLAGDYRRLFLKVDAVSCEGPFMAQSIRALGCPIEKVVVHRLGVPLDRLPYRPRTWQADGPLRILLAAAFREKKGLPYAIRAIGRLAAHLPVEVTVFGGETGRAADAAEVEQIRRSIRESGLESRIRLMGFQPYTRLLEAAYEHHIFVSPSVTAADGDTEGGCPVVLIEMAATGMPVISSRHADIPQVIRENETGLLADERDIDGLVACLEWLVEHPERWSDLTGGARARIERLFDVTLQAANLASLYRQILENPDQCPAKFVQPNL